MDWGFYGRTAERDQLREILARGRWFFCKITGRRRIGKTTLIQRALEAEGGRPFLYVQVPDSAPAGVLSAVADSMETFEVDARRFPRPGTLREFAASVGALARAGYVVVLDEFQYFHRKRLSDCCSLLQAVVDELSADAPRVPGGLIVLGSIHTEMEALLEDRTAPLYSRTTDEIRLEHLDIASVLEILRAHSHATPERLLFLWGLFEGVPKFYRDAHEQGVLDAPREDLLRRLFFESSSPLRTEADNWFLKELHGRYDVILKFVARHPGCTNAELLDHLRHLGGDPDEQPGGYLKVLVDRYRMVERRLPVFAKPRAPRGRYYLTDNFLRAWLAALAAPVSAVNFRPVGDLVREASRRLETVEGHAFERLVHALYAERSRKGLPGFGLTRRVQGYWDGGRTEIDLVALDEPRRTIRFAACRRSADRLDLDALRAGTTRFLTAFPAYAAWHVEHACIAPSIPDAQRKVLVARSAIPQDLSDLTAGL